uniref:Uncharacterized protein n=1 Tax=Arundo donax TaxID=35708 RepID=A0A0A9B460_ARUDO
MYVPAKQIRLFKLQCLPRQSQIH